MGTDSKSVSQTDRGKSVKIVESSTHKEDYPSKDEGNTDPKRNKGRGSKNVKVRGSCETSFTKILVDKKPASSRSSSDSVKSDSDKWSVSNKANEKVKKSENMKRLEKLHKQDQMKAIRTRKMNSVAKSQLEGTLSYLDNLYEKIRKERRRETTLLEDEMQKFEEDHKETTTISLPPVEREKSPNLITQPSMSPLPRAGNNADNNEIKHARCVDCRFNSTKCCRYFPCYLPLSYHSMGFKAREKSFTILKSYNDLLSRCAEARPPSNVREQQAAEEAKAEDASKKNPRTSVKDRERGLKLLVHEMRSRNYEKNKPRDWVINYGDPLPRRMLLKPVIPVSESFLSK